MSGFRIVFTKKLKGSDVVWTRSTPGPSPEFLKQFEAAVAIAPLMRHPIVNGYNQYMGDGFSGCKTEAAFHGQVDKNWTAVNTGTVRMSTQAIIVKKTDLELMVEKIAEENVDKTTPAGKKRTKAEREALIEFYLRVRRADLTVEAQTRLDNAAGRKDGDDAAVKAELIAMGLIPADPVEAPSAPTVIKGGKK